MLHLKAQKFPNFGLYKEEHQNRMGFPNNIPLSGEKNAAFLPLFVVDSRAIFSKRGTLIFSKKKLEFFGACFLYRLKTFVVLIVVGQHES